MKRIGSFIAGLLIGAMFFSGTVAYAAGIIAERSSHRFFVDGKEVENCGTTMIFAEKGLNPDVDFQSPEVINSKTDGSLGENVIIASVVNRFKNYFGKARVVVIQSQLGDPICAYSGDSVYYEVCEDLPKTTKLMIDGKALYIHRANFQIIDKELLN